MDVSPVLVFLLLIVFVVVARFFLRRTEKRVPTFEELEDDPRGNPTTAPLVVSNQAVVLMSTDTLPGHGFLVLRDRLLDRLEIDGLDVGNPEEPRPDFPGAFRGYFNVPPGRHELVAWLRGKPSKWVVDVEPNRAHVKRMNEHGGWEDDEPQIERQFEQLALSGSMLTAKALRPWPRCSMFFLSPPAPLRVNGKVLPVEGAICGVVNVPPGDVCVETPSHSSTFPLSQENIAVFSFDEDKPSLVGAPASVALARQYLMIAPREALMTHEQFRALPDDAGHADRGQSSR